MNSTTSILLQNHDPSAVSNDYDKRSIKPGIEATGIHLHEYPCPPADLDARLKLVVEARAA